MYLVLHLCMYRTNLSNFYYFRKKILIETENFQESLVLQNTTT